MIEIMLYVGGNPVTKLNSCEIEDNLPDPSDFKVISASYSLEGPGKYTIANAYGNSIEFESEVVLKLHQQVKINVE